MNRVLLERCRSLYNRARLGDASARQQIAAAKAMAKRGDYQSRMVYNTIAVLHWQSRQAEEKLPRWPHLETFYKRLAKNDLSAWAEMKKIQAKSRAGDERSKFLFSTLKAIHHQYKASVWYPGAPRMSGYGMPNLHHAGIDIPGASLVLTPEATSTILGLIEQAKASVPGLDPLELEQAASAAAPAPRRRVLAPAKTVPSTSTTPSTKPAYVSPLASKPVIATRLGRRPANLPPSKIPQWDYCARYEAAKARGSVAAEALRRMCEARRLAR